MVTYSSNTLLTPQQITREALRILHNKLTFIGNMNRQYDNSFAKAGAKIGETLRVRLPNQYVIRNGATLTPQATVENSVNLNVTSQMGVDMAFTSQDLTMNLDDFSERVLEPAMAVLAANMESTAITTLLPYIYQTVGTPGTTPNTLLTYLQSKARLDNSLAPMDNLRTAHLSPTAQVTIVDALKGLFQDSSAIKEQYREGMMGRAAGYDWYSNPMVPSFTTGSTVSGVTVNGASQTVTNPYTAQTFNIGGVANGNTFTAGMTFTIAGVYEVHPETKAVTPRLQQFVVNALATMAGTTGSISILPGICTSGAAQNVSAAPANGAAITFQTGSGQAWSANTTYEQEIAFHRDAFVFASADLVLPKGVDFAAREVFDGISMRIVRAYDIFNDEYPVRVDVLFGMSAVRPQLATRITA